MLDMNQFGAFLLCRFAQKLNGSTSNVAIDGAGRYYRCPPIFSNSTNTYSYPARKIYKLTPLHCTRECQIDQRSRLRTYHEFLLSSCFKMNFKPVIFMTLLLLFLFLLFPACLADGGEASGADDSTFYTFLITK